MTEEKFKEAQIIKERIEDLKKVIRYTQPGSVYNPNNPDYIVSIYTGVSKGSHLLIKDILERQIEELEEKFKSL